jgi:hypothetical protein
VSRILQSLILIDVLSSAFLGEKEKKKKRNSQGAFFPRLDMLCWLCLMGFSWLLLQLKAN